MNGTDNQRRVHCQRTTGNLEIRISLVHGNAPYLVPMNKTIQIGLASLCIVLLSCGTDEKCYYFPGSDRIEFLDTVKKGNTTYYLIIRTTGFQDKISVFELYDAKPHFTPCGEADRKALWVEDIEEDYPNKFVKEVVLHEQAEKKLEVVYTQNKNEAQDLYQVTLK